jgi:hypothetical protein
MSTGKPRLAAADTKPRTQGELGMLFGVPFNGSLSDPEKAFTPHQSTHSSPG